MLIQGHQSAFQVIACYNGERKSHLVHRDVLNSPREVGGQGIKRMDFFNQSLLGNELWRMLSNKNSLTNCWVSSKYGTIHDGLHISTPNSSWGWKSTTSNCELSLSRIKWLLGKGESVPINNKDLWYSPSYQPQDIHRVSDLINWSELSWNKTRLSQLYSPAVIKQILKEDIHEFAEDRLI